ncbi:MAG TPA: MBL fold metallo-hydrolase [Gemmatimonadaceae bacterium]|nr:MBL fold metallo-hydrolase [Gemmatimonadaceae bacterium]
MHPGASLSVPRPGAAEAARALSTPAVVLLLAMTAAAALSACGRGYDASQHDSATGSVAPTSSPATGEHTDGRDGAPRTQPTLTMRVLDVSDSRVGGQAVLLADSAERGVRYVLIDGGERPREVAQALRRLHVDTLALVVLTHAHADHYGGLTEVMRTFPVQAFAFNGDARTLASYNRMLAAVERSRARVIVMDSTARTVTLALPGRATVRLTLLGVPAQRSRSGDPENNRSVGVLVHFGRFSALVPGDAELDEMRWWMRRYGTMLDVHVLVAGHHGSANANSTSARPDWDRIVTPRVLLVSANGRQHPFAEVIDYARAHGIAVYCTHTSGAISVRATADGTWAVSTERPAACTAGSDRPH